MSTQLRKALSSNLLFKNIKLEEIDTSGIQGKLTVLKEGQYLYRKNDRAEYVFLIVNGKIKSLVEDDQGNKYLKNYEYPDYFGHYELFEDGIRQGDTIAIEDSFIIGLTKEEILFLASQDNRIKERLNIRDYEITGEITGEIEFDSEFTAQIEHDISELDRNGGTEAEDISLESELPSESRSDEEETGTNIEPDGEKETDELKPEDLFEPAGEFEEEEIETVELDQEIQSEDVLEEEEYQTEGVLSINNEKFDSMLANLKNIYSSIEYSEVIHNCEESLKSLIDADAAILISVSQKNLVLMSGDKKFNIIPMVSYEDSFIADALLGVVIVQNNPEEARELRDYFVFPEDYEINNFLFYPVKDEDDKISLLILLLNSGGGNFTDQNIQDIDRLSPHLLNAVNYASTFKNSIRNIRFTNFARFQNFFTNDIKKPLLVSKRYIEHILSKKPSEDISKILVMINEQIKIASQKFLSVTNYSQSEQSLKKIPMMINNVINSYLNNLEYEAKSNNIEIVKDFRDDEEIRIDVKEFEYCFNHIIRNAIESMKQGGEISVKIESANQFVTLSVADKGCGIPKVVLGDIFLPFYSYNKPENTGIGLTVAKNIIEKHGGDIQVRSEEDKGTEVIISLPRILNY